VARRAALSAVAAGAELIDDKGATARSDDFFRSPQFYAAEGVTHSLAISGSGRELALPLLVRDVGGSQAADAISPYGYPGAHSSGTGPAPVPEEIDWSQTGLISIFVRERIGGEACLAGARERSAVQIHDPKRPRAVRDRLAEQIRSNERRGWAVESLAGPAVRDADVDAFAAAYQQTMLRARAAARYFLEPGYFRVILGFERSWLLLARGSGDRVGAGAIAALSDGVLHYYLGGTADAALGESPFKNVVAAMLGLADELRAPLNLGGGVSAGDGLEEFKRGFANSQLPFRTHEIVCDRDEYERLHPGAAAAGFFPAYRAP
jgi:Acetyltransferase (GNAT) domain